MRRPLSALVLALLCCAATDAHAQEAPAATDAQVAPVVPGAPGAPPPSGAEGAQSALAAPAAAAAQAASRAAEPGVTIIRPLGPQYGFRDQRDATRFVFVALGGVEVVQGARTLKADTLVAVLLPDAKQAAQPGVADGGQPPVAGANGTADGASAGTPASAPDAVPEQRFADARVAELFLDGNVTVVEGDETIRANSFLLDNANGVATVVQGELRTVTRDGETLVARYELLHRLRDGSSRLTGLRYTNCDHANPHWHISTPEATLTPTAEGRILETSGNTVRWADVPVLWWPGLNLNIDRNQFFIQSLHVGHSSRFGTEIETSWEGDATPFATGVADFFGHHGTVRADWEVDVNLYSRRGLFTQPALSYRTDDSFGTFFGSYINDSADEDHLDQPIEDNQRGRIDLEHRTKIDEHKTLDIEVSRLSDSGFLQEYYDNEYREGKEQETYVSYRDVVDNHAWGVLARTRLNDFDTQVEYLPEVTHRIAGEQVGPAFLTMHDFISNARLMPSDDTDAPSARTVRAGNSSELVMPFDLTNGDRVSVLAGQDVTGFSDTVDDNGEVRYAANVGARWSRMYTGTGDAQSRLWNIDGLRRIVELRAGYFNRFALTSDPSELIQIDSVEQLDRGEVFTLGVRDRIQTHQDGRVATLLDSELILPLYPDAERDNDGDTLGPLLVDTRWVPRANITGLRDAVLRYRATHDLKATHYETSYSSFSTSIGDGRRLIIGNSAVAGEFNFITVSVQWLLNPRWTVAVFAEQDTRNNDKVRNGILLRQKAHCWYIDLELSNRRAEGISGDNKDETRIAVSLRPVGTDDDDDLIGTVESRIF